MQYALFIANAPDAWEPDPANVDPDVSPDWVAYTKALQEAGVLVSGAGLFDPDAATSVRIRESKLVLHDGPFAELKEHLVGFYVIDVDDLDTAIAWARRVPNVRTGVIEVRPIRPDLVPEHTLSLA